MSMKKPARSNRHKRQDSRENSMSRPLCKNCKWIRDPGPYAQCGFPIGSTAERKTEFTRAEPLVGFPRSPRMRGREIRSCVVQRAASCLWARFAPEGGWGKEGRGFEQ